ncbi:MAG: thioredoxin family protein [Rhodospirillaceae bacterium]|nr:thioredoxin family protein [Rhodospirillaceae bacterium]
MVAAMEFLVVLKRDCETCQLVEPALASLRGEFPLTLYSQDDPTFPEGLGGAADDRSLEQSWRLGVETVPTLVRLEDGKEVTRTEGWDRAEWVRVTGMESLGEGLPAFQPGCGSKTVEPGMPERLALKFGDLTLNSRVIDVAEWDDPAEIAFDRGWTDGLPITPATDLRVARMLAGTTRDPGEIIGPIPPNLIDCTIEKAAVNAVMAGCRPEYFPVVLAAIEAALKPEFSMHGLLATLWFSGPIIIVNGPVTKRIGMNWGGNALGQGNRANATIGRALQLVIRNVGGGRPQEIDRSVFGNPGKYTFCFAEDETDPDWVPLNVARGHAPGTSTVTLFHGDGVQGLADHKSRDAESLARSMAMGLCAVCHPKLAQWSNAILAISPDHYAIFKQHGWGRAEIEAAIWDALKRPGRDLIEGAQGVGAGIDPARAEEMVDKFHPGGLLVVRAGGVGGLFSAIIGGWTAHRRNKDVQTVSKEIGT